jgi:hypothetical protein
MDTRVYDQFQIGKILVQSSSFGTKNRTFLMKKSNKMWEGVVPTSAIIKKAFAQLPTCLGTVLLFKFVEDENTRKAEKKTAQY